MLTVHENALGMEGSIASTLDELVQEGARRMLVAAMEREVTSFLEQFQEDRDEHGHRLVVRNGNNRSAAACDSTRSPVGMVHRGVRATSRRCRRRDLRS